MSNFQKVAGRELFVKDQMYRFNSFLSFAQNMSPYSKNIFPCFSLCYISSKLEGDKRTVTKYHCCLDEMRVQVESNIVGAWVY